MIIKDLNESYINVKCDDISLMKRLTKTLSPFIENYRFNPKYRCGIWDGRINFYTKISNTEIQVPKGFKTSIVGFCKKNNEVIEYTKDKFENITREIADKFIASQNLPFHPYEYQIQAFIDSLNQGRLINESATGSGKSLIIYLLSKYFLEQDKQTLIIVPNIMLVNQIASDFESYGFKDLDKIQLIGGENKIKEILKPITISTWQSQYRSASGYENISCLIIDECQSAKGNESVLGTLIIPKCYNAKYRFGFTGTIPPALAEKMSIIACIGKINKVINAQGLINAGLATPVFIKPVYLNYSKEDSLAIHKLKDYHKEEKFITEHSKRNTVLTKIIDKVSSKGNTLALFSKLAHGDFLLKLLLKQKQTDKAKEIELIKKVPDEIKPDTLYYFKQKITEKQLKEILSKHKDNTDIFRSIEQENIFSITGEVSGKAREEIRQILETHSNALILATVSTMSTGVNIKNLHNLVFCSSFKSSITLLQSIGRVMRLHKSKEKVNIYDIVDSALSSRNKENYFLKHFKERLAIYLDSGYPIEEKEINL